MANTYTLISSNTLSSSAASVTFSSIPATYTDLVLRISARLAVYASDVAIQFNSDTTSNYSRTTLQGDGATATSGRTSNSTYTNWLGMANSTTPATANTFSNYELYIPNYTTTGSKQPGGFGVTESNISTGDYTTWITTEAGLYRGTAAISTILLDPTTPSGGSFITGSSFYLYGIKKN